MFSLLVPLFATLNILFRWQIPYLQSNARVEMGGKKGKKLYVHKAQEKHMRTGGGGGRVKITPEEKGGRRRRRRKDENYFP